jgi:hypothetical protein
MSSKSIENSLESILEDYKRSFNNKIFSDNSSDEDDLMLVFGLTQEIKSQNKQFWGRELGHCWEKIITTLCRQKCENFGDRIKYGSGRKHLCDFVIGDVAVDTKYRIGSGDQGTLDKFELYGSKLREKGYRPFMLILRKDNLSQAINACQRGGWTVKTDNETYEYISGITSFDLKSWLKAKRNCYNPNDIRTT